MKKIIAPLILLLILSVAVYLSKSDFLNIKTSSVNILGAECVGEQDVRQAISAQNPKIFLFKNQDFETKLKQKFKCIEAVKVDKKYPSSVNVSVVGRKAVVVLDNLVTSYSDKVPALPATDLEATSSSQSAISAPKIDNIAASASAVDKFLIDRTGLIFSDQPPSGNLPELSFLGDKLSINQSLDTVLISNVLATVTELNTLSVRMVERPIIYKNYLQLKAVNPGIIILALDKDINRQLASLQLILQASKINSDQMIESIDLRFNKPVVVYSSQKK